MYDLGEQLYEHCTTPAFKELKDCSNIELLDEVYELCGKARAIPFSHVLQEKNERKKKKNEERKSKKKQQKKKKRMKK